LRPFFRHLGWEQWQSILKRLAAISDHVSGGNAQMRPSAQLQLAQMEDMTRRADSSGRNRPPLLG
jgi:hypothetical protein